MEPPRVNPVGLLERPDELGSAAPRRFPRPVRALALALLAVFLLATVATSVVSLGTYCLTTDGGDTRALPGGLHPPAHPPR